MEFFDFPTAYSHAKSKRWVKKGVTASDFYKSYLKTMNIYNSIACHELQSQGAIDENVVNHIYGQHDCGIVEKQWHDVQRPYYNVWPGVVPLLLKLDLNKIASSQIEIPDSTLAIHFTKQRNPITAELFGETLSLRGILASNVKLRNKKHRGLIIVVDAGFSQTVSAAVLPIQLLNHRCPDQVTLPQYYYRRLELEEGVSIEEATLKSSRGVEFPTPEERTAAVYLLDQATRILATVCLIPQSCSELINPHLLAADNQRELTPSEQQRLFAKAINKRGGRKGHEVGRNYHRSTASCVVPPHPQVYHVGKGRTKAVVITRKGWVTHRRNIEEVPTGWHDKETGHAQD